MSIKTKQPASQPGNRGFLIFVEEQQQCVGEGKDGRQII